MRLTREVLEMAGAVYRAYPGLSVLLLVGWWIMLFILVRHLVT